MWTRALKWDILLCTLINPCRVATRCPNLKPMVSLERYGPHDSNCEELLSIALILPTLPRPKLSILEWKKIDISTTAYPEIGAFEGQWPEHPDVNICETRSPYLSNDTKKIKIGPTRNFRQVFSQSLLKWHRGFYMQKWLVSHFTHTWRDLKSHLWAAPGAKLYEIQKFQR